MIANGDVSYRRPSPASISPVEPPDHWAHPISLASSSLLSHRSTARRPHQVLESEIGAIALRRCSPQLHQQPPFEHRSRPCPRLQYRMRALPPSTNLGRRLPGSHDRRKLLGSFDSSLFEDRCGSLWGKRSSCVPGDANVVRMIRVPIKPVTAGRIAIFPPRSPNNCLDLLRGPARDSQKGPAG